MKRVQQTEQTEANYAPENINISRKPRAVKVTFLYPSRMKRKAFRRHHYQHIDKISARENQWNALDYGCGRKAIINPNNKCKNITCADKSVPFYHNDRWQISPLELEASEASSPPVFQDIKKQVNARNTALCCLQLPLLVQLLPELSYIKLLSNVVFRIIFALYLDRQIYVNSLVLFMLMLWSSTS